MRFDDHQCSLNIVCLRAGDAELLSLYQCLCRQPLEAQFRRASSFGTVVEIFASTYLGGGTGREGARDRERVGELRKEEEEGGRESKAKRE